MDKKAFGRPSWKVKVTGRERERRKSSVDAGRQTSAHRRSISQTESSSNIHMCCCEKQSKPSFPPVEAGLPLKLWRWGEVSRYRELLIRRGGGVLTLTSMQPARSSLAQLCQEASKAAPAARFQWYVCLIAWYSKIYLIFLRNDQVIRYCHRYQNILDRTSQKIPHLLFVHTNTVCIQIHSNRFWCFFPVRCNCREEIQHNHNSLTWDDKLHSRG